MSAEFWRLGSVWVDFRREFRNSSPIWMHMSGGDPPNHPKTRGTG
jgi:hypothetical protein